MGWNASRVLQYRLEDESMKEIGPDLSGTMSNYGRGIKAGNGSIYCMPCLHYMPCSAKKYVLKIIPREEQDAEVCILENQQLSVYTGQIGALADDGCMYYFPEWRGDHILKLDPNNDDNLSLVGEKFEDEFYAAVLGKDGYIYGISEYKIYKFNPKDYSVSQVGSDFDDNHDHIFIGAVLADDGNIYSANGYGQILKVDTVNNDWTIIGSTIYEDAQGWGRPVLGADKCIYFPPLNHDRVLTLNPITQSISLIGKSNGDREWKWRGAVLVSNGYIYCIPYNADDILQIDSRHINEQII